MRKYLILLLVPFLIASAPTRDNTYVTGELIRAADVTANEDALFQYVQGGVDTYKDDSILNADINSAANIQSGKLNLQSITQDVLFNNDGNDVVITIDNKGTNHALFITQDVVSAVGDAAFRVYSDQVQVNVPLAAIHQSSISADQAALEVRNDGTGSALFVIVPASQGNGTAILIDNNGDGHALHIRQDKTLAVNKHALFIESNDTQNSGLDASLVKIVQDDTNSVEAALEIDYDGTDEAFLLDVATAGGVHMRLIGDPNNSAPQDGDFWFDGTDMYLHVGTTSYKFGKRVEATGIVAQTTFQLPHSPSLPAACNTGELYFDEDADTTGSVYVCTTAGSWKDIDDD